MKVTLEEVVALKVSELSGYLKVLALFLVAVAGSALIAALFTYPLVYFALWYEDVFLSLLAVGVVGPLIYWLVVNFWALWRVLSLGVLVGFASIISVRLSFNFILFGLLQSLAILFLLNYFRIYLAKKSETGAHSPAIRLLTIGSYAYLALITWQLMYALWSAVGYLRIS